MQHSLPRDDRGVYAGSLVVRATGVRAPPCVLSGYPVLNRARLDFPASSGAAGPVVAAIREDWTKFNSIAKVRSDRSPRITNFTTLKSAYAYDFRNTRMSDFYL